MVNLADLVQTVLPFNQLASAEMEQVRQQLAVVSVPQGKAQPFMRRAESQVAIFI